MVRFQTHGARRGARIDSVGNWNNVYAESHADTHPLVLKNRIAVSRAEQREIELRINHRAGENLLTSNFDRFGESFLRAAIVAGITEIQAMELARAQADERIGPEDDDGGIQSKLILHVDFRLAATFSFKTQFAVDGREHG